MDRPKALALAAAVTMSLVSGVIALGANTGALGFGRATPVSATKTVALSASRGTRSTASNTQARAREHDDGGASPAANTRDD